MMWNNSRHLISRYLILAILVLFTGTSQAHASRIDHFSVKQNKAYPEVRVGFNRAIDNWDKVKGRFKPSFNVTLKVYSALPLNYAASYTRLSYGDQSKRYSVSRIGNIDDTPRKFWNRQWHTRELSFKASKIDGLPERAISICQRIRSKGGKPNKQHKVRISFFGKAKVFIQRQIGGPGSKKSKEIRLPTLLYVICEKDPEWKEPEKNDNIVSLSLKNENISSKKTCPSKFREIISVASTTPGVYDIKRQELGRAFQQTLRIKVGNIRKRVKVGSKYQMLYVGTRVSTSTQKQGETWIRVYAPRTRIYSDWVKRSVECEKFKVLSAWLKYEVADTPYCEKSVKEIVTFTANLPGRIDYEIKHQLGYVAHRGHVQAVWDGKAYSASATRQFKLGQTDIQMMADVKNHNANSGWVPLKVNCMKRLDASLSLHDLNKNQACPRKAVATVKMSFDRYRQKVRYKLSCTGSGRTWTKDTVSQKRRHGPGFGITNRYRFQVSKSEDITCAVHDLFDGGKLVAVARRKFNCTNPATLIIDNPPKKTCKQRWRNICKRVPLRKCRMVKKTECKPILKRTCTTVPTNKCTVVSKRICNNSSNGPKCRLVPKRECKRIMKRVCKQKVENHCTRKNRRECRTTFDRQCQRKLETICTK